MISKELLSDVLCIDLSNKNNMLNPIPVGKECGSATIFYWLEDEDRLHSGSSINIHELAHKCKKWAVEQDYGYIINSCIKYTFGYAQVEWYEKNHKDKHGTYREHTFKSEWFKATNNSEPEAIFKACQWILDNK